MNNAEHIHAMVRRLAEAGQMTLTQAVEMIEELTHPHIEDANEPLEFERVNLMVHRLINVRADGGAEYAIADSEDEKERAEARNYARWARVHRIGSITCCLSTIRRAASARQALRSPRAVRWSCAGDSPCMISGRIARTIGRPCSSTSVSSAATF